MIYIKFANIMPPFARSQARMANSCALSTLKKGRYGRIDRTRPLAGTQRPDRWRLWFYGSDRRGADCGHPTGRYEFPGLALDGPISGAYDLSFPSPPVEETFDGEAEAGKLIGASAEEVAET